MITRFLILDEKGEAVPIRELDRQAAEFWKVEQEQGLYTSPKANLTSIPEEQQWLYISAAKANNWYDTIGWSIYYNHINLEWKLVKEDLQEYPEHVRLCEYWENKGYKPKRI